MTVDERGEDVMSDEIVVVASRNSKKRSVGVEVCFSQAGFLFCNLRDIYARIRTYVLRSYITLISYSVSSPEQNLKINSQLN